MFPFSRQRLVVSNALFQGHYIDAKVFYTLQFNRIPAVSFIGELDGTKAFRYLQDRFRTQVTAIYQHTYFDYDKNEIFFNNSLFVFKDKRMVELASNYCHVLHTGKQYTWAQDLITNLAAFRVVKAAVHETRVIGFARNNSMN